MRQLIRTYFEQMKTQRKQGLPTTRESVWSRLARIGNPIESVQKSELLFLFGRPAKPDRNFDLERAEHDDFVIGDFSDSYLNLPLKIGLSWNGRKLKWYIACLRDHLDKAFLCHAYSQYHVRQKKQNYKMVKVPGQKISKARGIWLIYYETEIIKTCGTRC